MSAPYFTSKRRPQTAPTLPTHDAMGRTITWHQSPIGLTSTTMPLPSELPQLRTQCHRCFAPLAEEERARGLCPACQPPDLAATDRKVAVLEARVASLERRLVELSNQNAEILSMKVSR